MPAADSSWLGRQSVRLSLGAVVRSTSASPAVHHTHPRSSGLGRPHRSTVVSARVDQPPAPDEILSPPSGLHFSGAPHRSAYVITRDPPVAPTEVRGEGVGIGLHRGER